MFPHPKQTAIFPINNWRTEKNVRIPWPIWSWWLGSRSPKAFSFPTGQVKLMTNTKGSLLRNSEEWVLQRPCLWSPLKLTRRFPFLGISGSTLLKKFFLEKQYLCFQVIRRPKILSGVTTIQVHFVVLAPLTGVPVSWHSGLIIYSTTVHVNLYVEQSLCEGS